MRSPTTASPTRSTSAPASPADLTTRARIRECAIEVFVREGFGAGVRTIARHAGVSPGLVIHHFGSKDELRAECDRRVLELVRTRTDAVLTDGRIGVAVTDALGSIGEYGPMLVYLTRILAAGGETARDVIDRLVSDTEASVRHAVATGVIYPSVDEHARARYLVAMSLGSLTVDLVTHPPVDPTDGAAILRDYAARTMVPATEYATQGLLRDTSAWDAVLADRASSGHTFDETGQ